VRRLTAALLLAAAPAAAETPDPGPICDLIAASAAEHALPPDYFARLIWRESRFDVKALSPKGAQGVAQFMPATAALRGLTDPWDPAQAIPASAAYLAELRARFGNLGLAAAAYNAGEGRVTRWLEGASGLPAETRAYVPAITGREADWFRARAREAPPWPLDPGKDFGVACRDLPVMRTRAAPWRVLLVSAPSREGARNAFERLRRRNPALRGETPSIRRNAHRRSHAQMWQVSIPRGSRQAAMRLCAKVRIGGGVCVVRRG